MSTSSGEKGPKKKKKEKKGADREVAMTEGRNNEKVHLMEFLQY